MSCRAMDRPFFVMIFYATEDTIRTERELSRYFETTIMPTPREITQSCGFAIRFAGAGEQEILDRMADIQVPCALYYLGQRDDNKKRSLKLIAKQ